MLKRHHQKKNVRKYYEKLVKDFESTLSIPIELLTESGRAKMKDAFENSPENLVKTVQGAWAATATPYTVAGALYGFAGHAYSHTLGDGKSTFEYNSEYDTLEFSHNPIHYKQDGGGITLGHTINYLGNRGSADAIVPTYDANYQGWNMNINDSMHLGAHERHHVKQYDNTGILFIPSYFMNGGISHKNPYEQEADKFGHQGYINQQNR